LLFAEFLSLNRRQYRALFLQNPDPRLEWIEIRSSGVHIANYRDCAAIRFSLPVFPSSLIILSFAFSGRLDVDIYYGGMKPHKFLLAFNSRVRCFANRPGKEPFDIR